MIFKDFERAKAESGLGQVISLVSPKDIPGTLSDFGYKVPKILGLEQDVLCANQYILFQKIFAGSAIMDISLEIRLQRAVKSDYEIMLIQESSRMADKVAAKVPDLIKEGLTEIEFAGMLEAYARSLGHHTRA